MTYKEKYKKRVFELKKRLPVSYGVLFKDKYPKANMQEVYSVVNKCVVKEDVLVLLEKAFPKINSSKDLERN